MKNLIEKPDRKKIRDRTVKYPDIDYDYRIEINPSETDEFEFLVVGDSGRGDETRAAKFEVTKSMMEQANIDFILHLGDVVYFTGAKKGYKAKFIKPFKYWLKNDENHNYRNMVFSKPVLPVYGNHDYYDFGSKLYLKPLGWLLETLQRDRLGGSENGKVFETAFISRDTSKINNGVLPYLPNLQTKLPNRYYWFTYGCCAFFALDSNTLDTLNELSDEKKKRMRTRRRQINESLRNCVKELGLINDELAESIPDEEYQRLLYTAERLESRISRLEVDKSRITKLIRGKKKDYDIEQINWLEKVLTARDVQGKWKIVYMHHPLYSSDDEHTEDFESVGLREELRELFDKHGVNLVLSGHAHCFEWVKPNALDLNSNESCCYVISGGGGKNLSESILAKSVGDHRKAQNKFLTLAQSKAYGARIKLNDSVHNMYNYLKIKANHNSLEVYPIGVIEKSDDIWITRTPMPVKCCKKEGLSIRVESKNLSKVTVYKEKQPQATWD